MSPSAINAEIEAVARRLGLRVYRAACGGVLLHGADGWRVVELDGPEWRALRRRAGG